MQAWCIQPGAESNKALYMTTSVAYGWAGAVMPFKQIFRGKFQQCDGWTDGRKEGRMERPKDGPINGLTERQSDLKVVWTWLKIQNFFFGSCNKHLGHLIKKKKTSRCIISWPPNFMFPSPLVKPRRLRGQLRITDFKKNSVQLRWEPPEDDPGKYYTTTK